MTTVFVLQGVIANLTTVVRVKTVKVTDQRVGLMSEILNSIRLIKMYAWEDSFANKIAGKYRVHDVLNSVLVQGDVNYLLTAHSSYIVFLFCSVACNWS
jgi:hypothetical protein